MNTNAAASRPLVSSEDAALPALAYVPHQTLIAAASVAAWCAMPVVPFAPKMTSAPLGPYQAIDALALPGSTTQQQALASTGVDSGRTPPSAP